MTKREIWHPAEYDQQDIRSIQTLVLYAQQAVQPAEPGQEPPTPSPSDVKRVLDWIIEKGAGTYDEPFVAGQPDVVAYMLGRRSVGLGLIKLMRLRPEKVGK